MSRTLSSKPSAFILFLTACKGTPIFNILKNLANLSSSATVLLGGGGGAEVSCCCEASGGTGVVAAPLSTSGWEPLDISGAGDSSIGVGADKSGTEFSLASRIA